MKIKKLNTWEERFEADQLIATAFLHAWNEEDAKAKRKEEAAQSTAESEPIYALYDDQGTMEAAVDTRMMEVYFEGKSVPCGELEMVGSLPEYRGYGNIRMLMEEILHDLRNRGNYFAFLLPFSFAFYRKFGFEAVSKALSQKAPVEQFSCFRCDAVVRQVLSDSQLKEVRALNETFIRSFNLAEKKPDCDWIMRKNGQFGRPDPFHPDEQKYTYLFFDASGQAEGYLTFTFVHGPEGPFIGDMICNDIVFLTTKALRNILGFIYRIRAKIKTVTLRLPLSVDLGSLVPEIEEIERKYVGHMMARALDVSLILRALDYQGCTGTIVIEIKDDFLPENSGIFEVSIKEGTAVSVEKSLKEPDLSVTEETFTQLAIGFLNFQGALFREGTKARSNTDLLSKIFVEKPVLTI